MPALFTRMSIRPWRAITPPTASSALAGAATSTVANSARPPAAVISSATGRAFSPRAAATTVAPCFASVCAIARPMPRDAPVTSATRSERSIICKRALQSAAPTSASAFSSPWLFSTLTTVTDGSIFLISPASTVPGPQLDEGPRAVGDQPADDVFPAHRRRHLANQRIDGARGVGLRLRVDVGDDRKRRRMRRRARATPAPAVPAPAPSADNGMAR